MLSNRDPNGPGSGRNSRASNLSAMSRMTNHHAGEGGGHVKQDLLASAAPGVMSMLRTSTEMGNLGGLMGDGIGQAPRASQRRGTSSRLSTASSMSNQSSHAHRHHRQRPSSSSAARYSMPRDTMAHAPQYLPDTLSPTTMNLPGSSPLVPMRGRGDRDSHRSLSMTNTMPQPEYRLSNNRSLTSLRNDEHVQRSKPSYAYPTRLRRPGHRPASPAWSDIPGTHSRRLQTPASQMQANPPGHIGRRMPSDTSLGYSDRASGAPRYPSRGPSPVYHPMPNGDVPPVPPLYQHYHPAVEQARKLNRSIKGSISSGSTNMRTDSDTPSSDMPLPPTPRDGHSMDVLVGHSAANRMRRGAATRVRREEIPRGPVYYDYTEHFEHEEFVEPNIEHVPVGFASPIKTVVEEGEHVVAPSGTRESSSTKNSNSIERSELPDIAELPASPVGRRITRELIRSGLEANSTTGDAVSTTTVLAAKGGFGHSQRIRNQSTNGPGDGGNCGSFILPTGLDRSCHSVLSQTEQSMLNSSTLQFAVQCSIPAMTGVGPDVRPESEHEPVPKSPGSPEKNTDDGMSELLAGYQHTDSKQEDIIVPESETQPKVESVIVNGSDRTTQHAPNSSDEQSFKSCTDVLESIVPRSYEAQSSSASDSTSCALSRPKLPVKDPDAYSFQTCKNAATPDGTKSVLSSPLSSATADADMQCKRPTPGLPSTNSLLGIRKTVFGRHHSSFSIASKLRGSPKPSMKNGSMSTLGSSSTLGVPHQPPSVPPRESSASSEAQRLNAVGTFLMRRVIPVRFSKDKKLLPDAASEKKNSTDTVTGQCLQPSQNLAEPSGSPQKPPRISKVPEGVPGDRNALAKEHRPSNSSPTNDLRVTRVVVPPLHYHSLSTPSTGIIEAAAVPSPQDVSAKGRTYSLSTSAPLSLEQHRRDSQSTTHLSWAGRRPFGLPSASVSEPRLPLPSVQENTTTDLRLSVYKYNAPQRYLHDLKEDSHEDSSLNTSASNLKNSHFRFPHSNGIVVRTSVDDVVALAAKASLGSRRGSVVDDGHGLPSLEFSQADLFEKFKDALGDIRFSRSSGRTQLDLFDANEGSLQRGGQNGLERRRVNSLDGVESLGHSEQATGVDIAGSKRAYSPESLIAEIDQVSIPSVTQLSQRVTEMLPTLLLAGPHEVAELGDLCEFPAEKEIMEHAIDEIHHVHPPAQKRSSARLRPVRGASGLVIMEDDVYEEMTSKRGSRIVDDQCIRELEFEVEADEAGSHANNKGKDTAHAPTRHPSSIAELRAPSPAVLCLETCAASNRALRKSVESALSSTRSPGSFVSTRTATDTRPWNFDRNYPWATTAAPSVDISLPRPAALKQSPRPGPSHLRNTLSDATSSTFTSARTPTTSPTGEDSTFNANRQAHRLSIFGRNGDQAHAVGERYPTSALSPPTAIFRDHLSTCDTSDDEDFTTSRKTNRLTLRKRFSSAARTTTTPLITRTKVNPADLASPAPAHEQSSSTLQDRAGEARAFTSHRHTFRDAEGMRVSAYHRHRIVNNLKRWWHKGGELIRSISQRGSNRRRDVVQSAGN